jgi:single-strand DNA-binding protein
MNKVILIGRLTRDPETGTTNGQTKQAFARFTLAVDRSYKDANGNRQADFISCQAFGATADFIGAYFAKGSKIAVCGSIRTGSYQKADGSTVYTTDVIVDGAEFCESKSAGI